MKKMIVAFCSALGMAVALVSCGGGGGDSSSAESAVNGSGLAPAMLTGNALLEPEDSNVHAYIRLTNTPARVAYFGTDRSGSGHVYTGNYIYTKCGPNVVHLEIYNIRYEPIDTASDCTWKIDGYITFVPTAAGAAGTDVVFKGTETLIGTIDTQAGAEALPGPTINDTSGFGDGNNHFENTEHHAGGSRNFNLNYRFTMEGAQH